MPGLQRVKGFISMGNDKLHRIYWGMVSYTIFYLTT